MTGLASLAIILAVAVAAPIAVRLIARVAPIPLVVFEIVLGIVVGPSILGWVRPDEVITALSEFGLVLLFFMAGNEIDFARIAGRPVNRAALGWLLSLVVGVGVGLALAGGSPGGVFIGVALTSTALGTILPMIRDSGDLATPFGRAVTAVGAAGEFGPLLAISIFLSGRSPVAAVIVLLVFVVVVVLSVWSALRRPQPRLTALVSASLHTSGQFAIRLVLLVVVALVALSIALGLDMLLGAFAAGILCRALLRGASAADTVTVERKLEAVSFGFLVPVFFIVTGVTFDLDALLSDPGALLLLPVFLVLLLIVRGLPGMLAAPTGAAATERIALGLLAATGLPIIVAVTGIALDDGAIQRGTATALVGAGMLSVLLFPLIAFALRRQTSTTATGSGSSSGASAGGR